MLPPPPAPLPPPRLPAPCPFTSSGTGGHSLAAATTASGAAAVPSTAVAAVPPALATPATPSAGPSPSTSASDPSSSSSAQQPLDTATWGGHEPVRTQSLACVHGRHIPRSRVSACRTRRGNSANKRCVSARTWEPKGGGGGGGGGGPRTRSLYRGGCRGGGCCCCPDVVGVQREVYRPPHSTPGPEQGGVIEPVGRGQDGKHGTQVQQPLPHLVRPDDGHHLALWAGGTAGVGGAW